MMRYHSLEMPFKNCTFPFARIADQLNPLRPMLNSLPRSKIHIA